MKRILKVLWCCRIWHMNYEHNKSIDELLYRCIDLIENCPVVKVKIDYYYISIHTSSTKIEIWNANKYFAWCSSGCVNGREFNDVSPSRSAMYDFKSCLKRNGYNIHQPENGIYPAIILKDVKC